MPSCERVSPTDFHSKESRAYTEQCVRQLINGKTFQDYVSHVEYSERLYLTWIIVPIGLAIAFYYHLFFLLSDKRMWVVPHMDGIDDHPPLFALATALFLFFLGPCIVIAPFVGFHEPSTRRYALTVLLLFTCVNLALVSFGGRALHSPPFLESSPLLRWPRVAVAELPALAAAALARALPLQGAAVAGWIVFEWRATRWRQLWHVPLPLVTVPIFVGGFACIWFRVVNLVIPFVMSHEEERVGLVATAYAVLGVLKTEALKLFGHAGLPPLFTEPLLLYHAWWTAMILSFAYFFAVLLHPSICFVFRLIHAILPTHPTTWSLAVLSCGSAAFVLLQHKDAEAGPLLVLSALCVLLLRNGFVVE